MLEAKAASSAGKEAKKSEGIIAQPPTLACGENKVYQAASSAFHVKYNKDKGRYGISTHDLVPGDTVILEKPYTSVLDPEFYNVMCFHCARRVTVAVPCRRCSRARYCSDSCRQESWEQYHSQECSVLAAVLASRTGNMSLLVLRLLLQAGREAVLRCRKHPKVAESDSQHSLFTSNGVYMGGYVSLYNLLSHSEHRSHNDLFQYSLLAVFLLTVLGNTDFFRSESDVTKSEDDVTKPNDSVITTSAEVTTPVSDVSNEAAKRDFRKYTGGVILRFLQIVACNGIEITELCVGASLGKSDPRSVGLALYPTLSLLNHSCDPNVELIFYGSQCAVRAIQGIPSGREINLDYGYIYYVTPKDQRLLALRSQYFFDCKCVACSRNWSVKANIRSDIPVLKCRKCGTALRDIFEGADRAESGGASHQCRNCMEIQNPLEVYDKVQKASVLFERCLEQARNFDLKRAVPMLQHHLQLLDRYVVLPWKDYITCLSTLKQCYRMMGNRSGDPPTPTAASP